MKKRILTILLLSIVMDAAMAQQIKGYVNAGLTCSQVDGDELRGFKRNAVTAGVGALTNLGENFQLAMEIDFAKRGSYNACGDPYNIKLPLNYVDIPLMLYFHDPYGDMYFGAGLLYGRLVQQPHGTIQYDPAYFMPDTNDMMFDKNDVALVAEIRFRMVSHLYMSARWQRSIISVNDWTFTDKNHTWTNKCYNSSISVRLEWMFGEQDNGRGRKGNYSKRRR